VCFATQNLEELEQYADRVVVLAGGRAVFAGSPHEYEEAELRVFG
jgi:ABC-type multidrug transport system ATPase subunit